MYKPLITVAIPCYNAERTLLQTIASVRAQTFTDFEVLVLDDGSTDGSRALVESVQDSRIRCVSFENRGLPATRNRAIDHARGEFLSYIDADDLWTSDKLAGQLDALQRSPAAGAAYSWTAFVDDDTRFLFAKERTRFSGDVYRAMLFGNFVASGSNMLLRRACMLRVGRFDETVHGGADDWEYWIRFSRQFPITLVPRYQVLYRFSRASMSAQVEQTRASLEHVITRAFEQAPPELHGRRRESIAWAMQYVAFLHITRSNNPDALAKAWQSMLLAGKSYPRVMATGKSASILLACVALQLVPRRSRGALILRLMRGWGWLSRHSRGVPDFEPARS